MRREAEALLSQNIQLHICWVPGHVGVYDNEQADKAAKIAAAAENNSAADCGDELDISLTHLKSLVKKSLLQSWQDYYSSARKSAYYQNLDIQPAWKSLNLSLKSLRIE